MSIISTGIPLIQQKESNTQQVTRERSIALGSSTHQLVLVSSLQVAVEQDKLACCAIAMATKLESVTTAPLFSLTLISLCLCALQLPLVS